MNSGGDPGKQEHLGSETIAEGVPGDPQIPASDVRGRVDGPMRFRKVLGTRHCGTPGSEAVTNHIV